MTLKMRASQRDVQQKIRDALERHADVEVNNISISIFGGRATLSGTVNRYRKWIALNMPCGRRLAFRVSLITCVSASRLDYRTPY